MPTSGLGAKARPHALGRGSTTSPWESLLEIKITHAIGLPEFGRMVYYPGLGSWGRAVQLFVHSIYHAIDWKYDLSILEQVAGREEISDVQTPIKTNEYTP